MDIDFFDLGHVAAVFFLGRKHGKKVKQPPNIESPDPPVQQMLPFEAVGGYTPVAAIDGGFLPIKAEVDGEGIPRHNIPSYELPS